jgi:hypothetical protein
MKSIAAIALVAVGALIMPTTLLAGDAKAGAAGWIKEYPQADGSPARSCATCHTRDLTKAGKQASTGKTIEPMAPSVNPQRLSDPEKVEKWFRRNCHWTLGRACTDTEKADFVSFIKTQ